MNVRIIAVAVVLVLLLLYGGYLPLGSLVHNSLIYSSASYSGNTLTFGGGFGTVPVGSIINCQADREEAMIQPVPYLVSGERNRPFWDVYLKGIGVSGYVWFDGKGPREDSLTSSQRQILLNNGFIREWDYYNVWDDSPCLYDPNWGPLAQTCRSRGENLCYDQQSCTGGGWWINRPTCCASTPVETDHRYYKGGLTISDIDGVLEHTSCVMEGNLLRNGEEWTKSYSIWGTPKFMPSATSSYLVCEVDYITFREMTMSPSGNVAIKILDGTVIFDFTKSHPPDTPCTPNWQCIGWTPCPPEQVQTRTCTDSNECGTLSGKPAESQYCNYVPDEFCGDGICQSDETCGTCTADCGPCPPVCGNNICESGENSQNCAIDCGQPQPYCGDGYCQFGETQLNCPQDCGQPPQKWCGDGTCSPEIGENADSCPSDCYVEPPPQQNIIEFIIQTIQNIIGGFVSFITSLFGG